MRRDSLRTLASAALKSYPPAFDMAVRVGRRVSPDATAEAIKSATGSLPDVAFVQIGSNDGISNDPLREFVVRDKRWHGVVIEPVPHVFDRLRRNYSRQSSRLRFMNCAVSNQSGSTTFWTIRRDCLREFPRYALGLSSFDQQHIIKHFPGVAGMQSRLEALQVPLRTVDEIIDEAGLKRIDVLHIDAEGHDDEILKSVNFERVKPRIVILEIENLAKSRQTDAIAFLSSHGYRPQIVGMDCIATI